MVNVWCVVLCLLHVCLIQAVILEGLFGDQEITFQLFTNNGPPEGIRLTIDNSTLLKPAQSIVFVVHGWLESRLSAYWYPPLTQAYLKRTDKRYHVIQVDWRILARLPYTISSLKTETVGDAIAEFIARIVNDGNADVNQLEITGHSLGGQAAGFASKRVYQLLGKKIPRIIGLDPAGPLFPLGGDPSRALTRTDADMVLVIHTDGGAFGFLSPCGTIDIFINGGIPIQRGCPDDLFNAMFCSHHRSFKYFIEALNTGKFFVIKCGSQREYDRGDCNKNEKLNLGGTYGNETTDRVEYFLVTKHNRNQPFQLTTETVEEMEKEEWSQRVVLILHGWNENRTAFWYAPLTDAYLQRTDVNYMVIQCDYGDDAAMSYLTFSRTVKDIGTLIGDFILLLVRDVGFKVDDFEVTAHGVGCHVAGWVSRRIDAEWSRILPKIVALDPAGPMFHTSSEGLKPTDAEVVMCLRTDVGVFGIIGNCGTIDIYFNTGYPMQPGCPDNLSEIILAARCSHLRSTAYFTEALYTEKFYARQCNNVIYYTFGYCNNNDLLNIGMDITKDSNVSGTYYTLTNSVSLYAREDI